ncbi:unnamed protein product [Polarella glacialis]|uniref:Uncharacterized protein n=1 Tax=Polarella glacialis TaxID=89957 RepID=A0A813EBX1_POLGL|nr:unnamed protein product [Polarella glacialis]
MIMAVIESFKFLPGLAECPLLVTCDGAGKVCDQVRPKRGFVTAELADKYAAYVHGLQDALGANRVLVLPEREGFGLAVKAAVARVTTPYVLLCQHDNMFVRPIDLERVIRIMEANQDDLKCVHFVSPKSTFEVEGNKDGGCNQGAAAPLSLKRIEDRLGRLAGSARDFGETKEDGAAQHAGAQSPSTFWPMPSWLERNHVCSTAHYRDFVLGPETKLKPGQFIEETFGQRMRQDLAAGGSHRPYGIYRLLDDPESATLHLDGRAFLPVLEQKRRGWRVTDLYQRLELRHSAWLAAEAGGCWSPGAPLPPWPPMPISGSAAGSSKNF